MSLMNAQSLIGLPCIGLVQNSHTQHKSFYLARLNAVILGRRF